MAASCCRSDTARQARQQDELRLAAELGDVVGVGRGEGAGDERGAVGAQQIADRREEGVGALQVLHEKRADARIGGGGHCRRQGQGVLPLEGSAIPDARRQRIQLAGDARYFTVALRCGVNRSNRSEVRMGYGPTAQS